ncbi:hypothetical protein [Actinoplanes sp. NPDC049316]|uniref:hypothetical protein n=1 Tax=Actinoplanes sp. NPDC049316 TaxID=3154727 RepID=UPI0034381C90
MATALDTSEQLMHTGGVALLGDSAYVFSGNRLVRVNKASGAVTAVAGSATEQGCTDAPGAAARFNGDTYPSHGGAIGASIVIGSDGHLLYVRDPGCGIRTVDPASGATGTLTDVAGSDDSGLPRTVTVIGHTLYSSGWEDNWSSSVHGDPTIHQRDLVTGQTTVLATVPDGLDVIVADSKYVWAFGYFGMQRVDRSTGERTQMDYPFGLSADDITDRGNGPFWDGQVVSVGDYLYFVIPGFYDWDRIGRINKVTGERSEFAAGIGRPEGDTDHYTYPDGNHFDYLSGLATDGDNLYIAEYGEGTYRPGGPMGGLRVVSSGVKLPQPPPPPPPVDPPSPEPSPGAEKTFVYVALGDSYQSGEGAANNIADTFKYLSAYEDGINYPYNDDKGGQADTYTYYQSSSGDGCHRSLSDYAKINRDRLAPGAKVVLIDVTCSGAEIEGSDFGRPPVVFDQGQAGSTYASPDSQVAEAVRRLAAAHLGPQDVDLVTVGMGGNDANFPGMVAACLLPGLLQRALDLYPNAPGDIEFLVDKALNCERADRVISHFSGTDGAIDGLLNKELAAQTALIGTFGNARILQTNYPDILPATSAAPASCGGIRKEDLAYAHDKIDQLDGKIDDSTPAGDPIERVDMQYGFGINPLCPDRAEDTMANGLSGANVDAELRYLLNLDGNGDAQARKLLDNLVSSYRSLRNCMIVFSPALCALQGKWVYDDGDALFRYLGTGDKLKSMLAGLMGPASESENVRADRSQGLFHPNAKGHAVQACRVLAVYNHGIPQNCLGAVRATATGTTADSVNGQAVGNAPIPAAPGTRLKVTVGGYAPNSTVDLSLHSTRIDLGHAIADADGVVHTTVDLPAAEAGVHTLTISGNSGGGASLAKRVRVTYPGQPQVGGSYGTYLTGFQAATTKEKVDIIYGGEVVTTLTPDEDGGVYVELPVIKPDASGNVTITARSALTGKSTSTTIRPTPAAVGLWASGTTADALTLNGAGIAVTGPVHSNGGITVTGSGTTVSRGAEYATTLSVRGAGSSVPDAHRVDRGDPPAAATVDAYRPGGPAARDAGYHAIPASACKQNRWTVRGDDVPSGVVYVPCAVTINGSGRVSAVIVAEGPITAAGASLILGPDRASSPALLSAASGPAAIQVSGAGVQIRGTVQALDGEVAVTGAQSVLRCGVTAKSIRISGAKARVEVDDACFAS